MKKESLVNLLDAEWQKAHALLTMQLDIENGDFERAMRCQFEYLYWHDEAIRLMKGFRDERWDLVLRVHGV